MGRQSVLTPKASFSSVGIGIKSYHTRCANLSNLFYSATKIRAQNLLRLLGVIEGIEENLGLFKLTLLYAIFTEPDLKKLATTLVDSLLQGEYSSEFLFDDVQSHSTRIRKNTFKSTFFNSESLLNGQRWDSTLELCSGSEYSLFYTANKITIIQELLGQELCSMNRDRMKAFLNFCQIFFKKNTEYGIGFFESLACQLRESDWTSGSLATLMTLEACPAGSSIALNEFS